MTAGYELLRMLLDGAPIQAEALMQQLALDSATLRDAVQQLREEGFAVAHMPDGAYLLPNPPRLLDAAQIENELTAARVVAAGRLELLEVTGSTNEHLLRRPGSIHAFTCLAERQTAGRGRAGRSWQATPYGSILLSVGWEFGGATATMGASLAAGVAAIRALQQLGIEGVGLKWPNDLLAEGRKLGGILIDLRPPNAANIRGVVGLGLNVKMSSQTAADIDQPWADLAALGHGAIDRSRLAAGIIVHLCRVLEQLADEGFAALREEWLSHHVYQNRSVVVSMTGESATGKAIGIDERGALMLRDDTGGVRSVLAGDVSLRGAP
ncbi:MAG: biotin--[acetyl-CoA-carboxylase] ligase [Pseudomonadota bacterium]|nr:biotin--[acetyl-CoA-carboxylase] ligase [Pseudomonadota bacterium]